MLDIRLNKFKELLNAFSYASSIELHKNYHIIGEDTIPHFNIYISPRIGREIKKAYEQLPNFLNNAQQELLSNLYSIDRLIDKTHFLSLITFDFIVVYKASFEAYKVLSEYGIAYNDFDSRMDLNFFRKYIDLIYCEYYTQWINLIRDICIIYNINLIENMSVIGPSDDKDVLNLYQTLYLKK